MTPFTPGPWRAKGKIVYASSRDSPGESARVADCQTVDVKGGTQVANARLIAAAPSLLEACHAARLALLAIPQTAKDCSEAIDLLNAAIAKASS